jgi:hypothetical protein
MFSSSSATITNPTEVKAVWRSLMVLARVGFEVGAEDVEPGGT